jgi:hypothetical protein
MEERISIVLTGKEMQLIINALEILNPDDSADQERLHELYGKLLAAIGQLA